MLTHSITKPIEKNQIDDSMCILDVKTSFMDQKTKFIYQLMLGVFIITGVIFLSFRYLMKGPPMMKFFGVALIAGTSYLVFDFLKRKNKKRK